jgi:hypothetical protein
LRKNAANNRNAVLYCRKQAIDASTKSFVAGMRPKVTSGTASAFSAAETGSAESVSVHNENPTFKNEESV